MEAGWEEGHKGLEYGMLWETMPPSPVEAITNASEMASRSLFEMASRSLFSNLYSPWTGESRGDRKG